MSHLAIASCMPRKSRLIFYIYRRNETHSVTLISLGSEVSNFQAKCEHGLTFHPSCFSQNHFLFFPLLPLSTCKVAPHHSCLRRVTMVSLIPDIGCNCDVETCLKSVFFCKMDHKKKKGETQFDFSESEDKD